MRSVLIDPEAKTVEELEIDDSLDRVREVLRCACITSFWWRGGLALTDDEGLFKPGGDDGMLAATQFEGFGPVAGRVLLRGRPTSSGDDTACALSVEEVTAAVRFGRLLPLA